MEPQGQPRLSATTPCVSANPKGRHHHQVVLQLVARLLWSREAALPVQSCLLHSAHRDARIDTTGATASRGELV